MGALSMLRAAAKVVLNSALSALPSAARSSFKRYHELRYWRGVTRPIRDDRTKLEHERSHYEQFFTSFFGLAKADYAGGRLLDIGCGPCGSLEWASEAAERVGLDPLAEDYKKLVGDTHKMTYCASPSEAIPYPDGHFDSVSSFNSLDHVDDVEATIAEIKRVTAANGRVLLIVEIGHIPTPTEPHHLDETIVEKFGPEFAAVSLQTFGVRHDHNVYGSMLDAIPYIPGKPGILAARLERKA
jgi:SAM-dependent methyltransferase